jgi:hypothetical protein
MSGGVDRAADELYGLPLEEFVPRRDELVRELRGAGQKDDAEMVKRMPKPTAPAWVVNQLARTEPDDMRALMQAGDELRRTQEWLLRGEADPTDLRSAVEAERAAVGRLVRMGAALLTAAGRPPRGDILERVGETLHAATADPALRAEVERGRVAKDQAAVGLGPATGPGFAPAGATRRSTRRAPSARSAPSAPPEAPPASKRTKPAKPARPARAGTSEEAEARRRAAAEARRELRAAEAEAKAAERMRVSADRAVERATRSLTSAEASYERARDELQEAREELAAAEKAAAAAREAADAAQADIVDQRRRMDAADE